MKKVQTWQTDKVKRESGDCGTFCQALPGRLLKCKCGWQLCISRWGWFCLKIWFCSMQVIWLFEFQQGETVCVPCFMSGFSLCVYLQNSHWDSFVPVFPGKSFSISCCASFKPEVQQHRFNLSICWWQKINAVELLININLWWVLSGIFIISVILIIWRKFVLESSYTSNSTALFFWVLSAASCRLDQ